MIVIIIPDSDSPTRRFSIANTEVLRGAHRGIRSGNDDVEITRYVYRIVSLLEGKRRKIFFLIIATFYAVAVQGNATVPEHNQELDPLVPSSCV